MVNVGNRIQRMTIMVSEGERDFLKALAKRTGQPVGRMVRSMVLADTAEAMERMGVLESKEMEDRELQSAYWAMVSERNDV